MEPLYLSGPMSGLPDFNFPAFTAACASLRQHGYTVRSPHEKDGEGQAGDAAYIEYLRADISLLLECRGGIVLLPGWPRSKGATLELSIALGLKMPVWFYRDGGLISMSRL